MTCLDDQLFGKNTSLNKCIFILLIFLGKYIYCNLIEWEYSKIFTPIENFVQIEN